jgi:ABC-type phosphonate transport system ATPase subunit
MAGRANGASTRPAIMNIASSRRIVIWRSMRQNPTDGLKMKVSRTNDAVMRKARRG